ncbi:MAG: hypothetical protein HY481_01340 [Candidatus Vogelbacteria bacterium]|nr:hypothetical protein [Candidatus Vogelbacteria bacterium]
MWWLILLAIAGILVLLFVLSLILAYLGWHFTRIEKGHTVFITQGADLKVVWPNVGSHRMSKVADSNGWHWVVKDDTEGSEDRIDESFYFKALSGTVWLQKLLWKRLGIRFVSILWPHIRVHEFMVSRKRLKEGAEVESGKPIRERIVESKEKDKPVRSLLFIVPRPVYVDGVELAGDNSKINLVFLVVFQQVIPALPVYYLEGDFFPLLDAAIEAALVDFGATYEMKDEDGKLSHLTLASWLKLPKAEGSPIEKHLRRINVSKKYYEDLEKDSGNELLNHLEQLIGGPPKEPATPTEQEKIGSGIIPRFGFALTSVRLVAWEPHKDSEDLYKALRAEETERRTAAGLIEKAKGEKTAFEQRGTGEGGRYERLLKALIDKGVASNKAAEVVQTQIEMEQLHQSGVGTYVRNASAGVMVPASTSTPSSSSPGS